MLIISDASLWEGVEVAEKEGRILDAAAVGGVLDALAGPSHEDKRLRQVKLVQSVKEGDEWAFAELIREHWPSVIAQCVAYVKDRKKAEEIATQAAQKIWVVRERLDPLANFRGFLLKTAARCCLDFFRREGSGGALAWSRMGSLDAQHENDEGDTVALGDTLPDPTSADFAELLLVREAVQGVMNKLSEVHRTVLLLHFFSGFSRKEIADMQGCSEQNVGHHIRNALNEFRMLYRDQQSEKGRNSV